MAASGPPARKGFQLVVAATRSLGIGQGGTIPWRLPGDMAYFKELTATASASSLQNAVIMGRRTWESIPAKFRPLMGRINVVLSRSFGQQDQENDPAASNKSGSSPAGMDIDGVHCCGSLEAAMELLTSTPLAATVDHVFVIGGGQVYQEAMASELCEAVHLTSIDADFDCDTHFPAIDNSRFRLWSTSPPRRDKDVRYTFLCYTRTDLKEPPRLPAAVASRHEEHQYLDLAADLIKTGSFRPDRTGTGTFGKFGCQMRFDLRRTFPLLTTKRVFWRGVAEELLWFIRGSTNAKELQARGVRIWDGNSSREFLDSAGLGHREEGDLGPVYGFQWRHFGADYTDMHADYSGKGVDQLAGVIHQIRTDPYNRRIVLTAWNPAALRLMALPPCHMFCQFYVADGELSCLLYQRSCDLGLGVPFNIASYALLTRMIAQVCELVPGELVHMMGDTHVYANHVEPLQRQLLNAPKHLPTLRLNPDRKEIDDFQIEDFVLEGYRCHAKIDMQMAV